jgi:hypothetical protein
MISHHAQNLAAVVSSGYIYTSTDAGATWMEQTDAGSRGWRSIASSSDGTVRVWMQVMTQGARCPCPRWWSHRVCMSGPGSACDTRSDASSSTIHPIIHRTLPPWCLEARSGPTRRCVHVPGGESGNQVLSHRSPPGPSLAERPNE